MPARKIAMHFPAHPSTGSSHSKSVSEDLQGISIEQNVLASSNPAASFTIVNSPEEAKQTKFEWTWLTIKRRDHSAERLAIAAVASSVIMLLLAVIIGVVFNVAAWADTQGVSIAGYEINFILFNLTSCSVAIAAGLVRFFVRYFCHKRIHGIFSFAMYWVLAGLVFSKLYEPYYHPGTLGTTTQATRQILNMAGNTLPWNDSNDAATLLQTTELTWDGIVSAADFYNWLKQPMRYVITGQKVNSENLGNLDYIPTLISNATAGYAVWHMLSCELRQVRTRMEPLDPPVYSTPICKAGYSSPCYGQSTSGLFTQGVPVYEDDKQDTTVRYRTINGVYQPIETFSDNSYRTFYGDTIDARIYAGYYYYYPGKSGQRYIGPNMTGVWNADSTTVADYLAQVKFMEEQRWIDEQTALVQLSCTAEVPTQNLLLYFLYSAEFTSAGLMRPSYPYIGTSFIIPKFHPNDKLDVLALFAWYFLFEELQDCLVQGPSKYMRAGRSPERQHGGMTNVIDILSALSSLLALGFFYTQLGYIKAIESNHFYSQMDAAKGSQWFAGLLMFFVALKGVKFTKNIPVMRACADTMAACKLELFLFTAMLSVLILAFAFIFNAVFSTRVDEYSTLWLSTISLFRGMVGDMDYNQIYFNEPVVGPFLYFIYLNAVLFIGFTILIAVISAGYDRACELPNREGMVRDGIRYLLRRRGESVENLAELTDYELLQSLSQKQIKEEEKEEKVGNDLETLKRQVFTTLSKLEDAIEENVQHDDARLDALSRSIDERFAAIEQRFNQAVSTKVPANDTLWV